MLRMRKTVHLQLINVVWHNLHFSIINIIIAASGEMSDQLLLKSAKGKMPICSYCFVKYHLYIHPRVPQKFKILF